MKSRAATAFRAGISAVALALAVSTAAAVPASAQAPTVGERSVSAHQKSSAQVFRSVKVSPSRPVVGTEVTVTGRAKGVKRRVVLQVRAGGAWRKVAATRTRKSKFSFTYDVTAAKPRSLRVVARTAPKVKRSAQLKAKGPKRSHRKLKSRRVVSRVVRIIVRPAPVVPAPPVPTPPVPTPPTPPVTPPSTPAPTPDPDAAFAAEVREAVDADVRAYRASQGLDNPVGTSACMSQWADGYAAEMAENNLLVNSASSEWEGDIVSSDEVCLDNAPMPHRQEAVTRVEGATPQEVSDKVLQAFKDAWMHDEALLNTAGKQRVLSVGAARSDDDKWYVVAVFAFDAD